MGEGEAEALGDELLDVRALDIVALLELDDLEDLLENLLVGVSAFRARYST